MTTYVSSTKTASLLGVTRSTVDGWCRRGCIKAKRDTPTGNWLIDLDSLIDVVYANKKHQSYLRDLKRRGPSAFLRDQILQEIDSRPLLLDMTDVEIEYGISAETLRYWVRKGLLSYAPYTPTYGKLTVYAEDLEKAIDIYNAKKGREPYANCIELQP